MNQSRQPHPEAEPDPPSTPSPTLTAEVDESSEDTYFSDSEETSVKLGEETEARMPAPANAVSENSRNRDGQTKDSQAKDTTAKDTTAKDTTAKDTTAKFNQETLASPELSASIKDLFVAVDAAIQDSEVLKDCQIGFKQNYGSKALSGMDTSGNFSDTYVLRSFKGSSLNTAFGEVQTRLFDNGIVVTSLPDGTAVRFPPSDGPAEILDRYGNSVTVPRADAIKPVATIRGVGFTAVQNTDGSLQIKFKVPQTDGATSMMMYPQGQNGLKWTRTIPETSDSPARTISAYSDNTKQVDFAHAVSGVSRAQFRTDGTVMILPAVSHRTLPGETKDDSEFRTELQQVALRAIDTQTTSMTYDHRIDTMRDTARDLVMQNIDQYDYRDDGSIVVRVNANSDHGRNTDPPADNRHLILDLVNPQRKDTGTKTVDERIEAVRQLLLNESSTREPVIRRSGPSESFLRLTEQRRADPFRQFGRIQSHDPLWLAAADAISQMSGSDRLSSVSIAIEDLGHLTERGDPHSTIALAATLLSLDGGPQAIRSVRSMHVYGNPIFAPDLGGVTGAEARDVVRRQIATHLRRLESAARPAHRGIMDGKSIFPGHLSGIETARYAMPKEALICLAATFSADPSGPSSNLIRSILINESDTMEGMDALHLVLRGSPNPNAFLRNTYLKGLNSDYRSQTHLDSIILKATSSAGPYEIDLLAFSLSGHRTTDGNSERCFNAMRETARRDPENVFDSLVRNYKKFGDKNQLLDCLAAITHDGSFNAAQTTHVMTLLREGLQSDDKNTYNSAMRGLLQVSEHWTPEDIAVISDNVRQPMADMLKDVVDKIDRSKAGPLARQIQEKLSTNGYSDIKQISAAVTALGALADFTGRDVASVMQHAATTHGLPSSSDTDRLTVEALRSLVRIGGSESEGSNVALELIKHGLLNDAPGVPLSNAAFRHDLVDYITGKKSTSAISEPAREIVYNTGFPPSVPSLFRELGVSSSVVGELSSKARENYSDSEIRSIISRMTLYNTVPGQIRAEINPAAIVIPSVPMEDSLSRKVEPILPGEINPLQIIGQLANNTLAASDNNLFLTPIETTIQQLRERAAFESRFIESRFSIAANTNRDALEDLVDNTRKGVSTFDHFASWFGGSTLDEFTRLEDQQIQNWQTSKELLEQTGANLQSKQAREEALEISLATLEYKKLRASGDERDADLMALRLLKTHGSALAMMSPQIWKDLGMDSPLESRSNIATNSHIQVPRETVLQRLYRAGLVESPVPPKIEFGTKQGLSQALTSLSVRYDETKLDAAVRRAYAFQAIDTDPAMLRFTQVAMDLQTKLPELQQLVRAGEAGTRTREYSNTVRQLLKDFATTYKEVNTKPEGSDTTPLQDAAASVAQMKRQLNSVEPSVREELSRRIAAMEQMLEFFDPKSQTAKDMKLMFDKADSTSFDESGFRTWLNSDGLKTLGAIVGGVALAMAAGAVVVASFGTATPLMVVMVASAAGGALGGIVGHEATSEAMYKLGTGERTGSQLGHWARGGLVEGDDGHARQLDGSEVFLDYSEQFGYGFAISLATLGVGKLLGNALQSFGRGGATAAMRANSQSLGRVFNRVQQVQNVAERLGAKKLAAKWMHEFTQEFQQELTEEAMGNGAEMVLEKVLGDVNPVLGVVTSALIANRKMVGGANHSAFDLHPEPGNPRNIRMELAAGRDHSTALTELKQQLLKDGMLVEWSGKAGDPLKITTPEGAKLKVSATSEAKPVSAKSTADSVSAQAGVNLDASTSSTVDATTRGESLRAKSRDADAIQTPQDIRINELADMLTAETSAEKRTEIESEIKQILFDQAKTFAKKMGLVTRDNAGNITGYLVNIDQFRLVRGVEPSSLNTDNTIDINIDTRVPTDALWHEMRHRKDYYDLTVQRMASEMQGNGRFEARIQDEVFAELEAGGQVQLMISDGQFRVNPSHEKFVPLLEVYRKEFGRKPSYDPQEIAGWLDARADKASYTEHLSSVEVGMIMAQYLATTPPVGDTMIAHRVELNKHPQLRKPLGTLLRDFSSNNAHPENATPAQLEQYLSAADLKPFIAAGMSKNDVANLMAKELDHYRHVLDLSAMKPQGDTISGASGVSDVALASNLADARSEMTDVLKRHGLENSDIVSELDDTISSIEGDAKQKEQVSNYISQIARQLDNGTLDAERATDLLWRIQAGFTGTGIPRVRAELQTYFSNTSATNQADAVAVDKLARITNAAKLKIRVDELSYRGIPGWNVGLDSDGKPLMRDGKVVFVHDGKLTVPNSALLGLTDAYDTAVSDGRNSTVDIGFGKPVEMALDPIDALIDQSRAEGGGLDTCSMCVSSFLKNLSSPGGPVGVLAGGKFATPQGLQREMGAVGPNGKKVNMSTLRDIVHSATDMRLKAMTPGDFDLVGDHIGLVTSDMLAKKGGPAIYLVADPYQTTGDVSTSHTYLVTVDSTGAAMVIDPYNGSKTEFTNRRLGMLEQLQGDSADRAAANLGLNNPAQTAGSQSGANSTYRARLEASMRALGDGDTFEVLEKRAQALSSNYNTVKLNHLTRGLVESRLGIANSEFDYETTSPMERTAYLAGAARQLSLLIESGGDKKIAIDQIKFQKSALELTRQLAKLRTSPDPEVQQRAWNNAKRAASDMAKLLPDSDFGEAVSQRLLDMDLVEVGDLAPHHQQAFSPIDSPTAPKAQRTVDASNSSPHMTSSDVYRPAAASNRDIDVPSILTEAVNSNKLLPAKRAVYEKALVAGVLEPGDIEALFALNSVHREIVIEPLLEKGRLTTEAVRRMTSLSVKSFEALSNLSGATATGGDRFALYTALINDSTIDLESVESLLGKSDRGVYETVLMNATSLPGSVAVNNLLSLSNEAISDLNAILTTNKAVADIRHMLNTSGPGFVSLHLAARNARRQLSQNDANMILSAVSRNATDNNRDVLDQSLLGLAQMVRQMDTHVKPGRTMSDAQEMLWMVAHGKVPLQMVPTLNEGLNAGYFGSGSINLSQLGGMRLEGQQMLASMLKLELATAPTNRLSPESFAILQNNSGRYSRAIEQGLFSSQDLFSTFAAGPSGAFALDLVLPRGDVELQPLSPAAAKSILEAASDKQITPVQLESLQWARQEGLLSNEALSNVFQQPPELRNQYIDSLNRLWNLRDSVHERQKSVPEAERTVAARQQSNRQFFKEFVGMLETNPGDPATLWAVQQRLSGFERQSTMADVEPGLVSEEKMRLGEKVGNPTQEVVQFTQAIAEGNFDRAIELSLRPQSVEIENAYTPVGFTLSDFDDPAAMKLALDRMDMIGDSNGTFGVRNGELTGLIRADLPQPVITLPNGVRIDLSTPNISVIGRKASPQEQVLIEQLKQHPSVKVLRGRVAMIAYEERMIHGNQGENAGANSRMVLDQFANSPEFGQLTERYKNNRNAFREALREIDVAARLVESGMSVNDVKKVLTHRHLTGEREYFYQWLERRPQTEGS